jgi:sugar (pentulose or hexulose) kinase
VQECLRQWIREGHNYTWSEMMSAAGEATPFHYLIDPDAPQFSNECDMPRAIHDYCVATGQRVPQTVGAIVRGAFESLSLKYRSVLESLRSLTHRPLSTIRVVGGGGLNTLLCQMTADACGCLVVSGPVEASTFGNVMMQAVATGYLSNVRSGRIAIAESVECATFSPHRSGRWVEAYERFRALPSC